MKIDLTIAKPVEEKDSSKAKVTRTNKLTKEKYETYPSHNPPKFFSNLFIANFSLSKNQMPKLDKLAILTPEQVSDIATKSNAEYSRLGWKMRLNPTPGVQFKAILTGLFEPKLYEYEDDNKNTCYGLQIQYEHKERPNSIGMSFEV